MSSGSDRLESGPRIIECSRLPHVCVCVCDHSVALRYPEGFFFFCKYIPRAVNEDIVKRVTPRTIASPPRCYLDPPVLCDKKFDAGINLKPQAENIEDEVSVLSINQACGINYPPAWRISLG